MKTQTISNAVQAIQAAMSAGDSLKQALSFNKQAFFTLSKREWKKVKDWAESEYFEGVKAS